MLQAPSPRLCFLFPLRQRRCRRPWMRRGLRRPSSSVAGEGLAGWGSAARGTCTPAGTARCTLPTPFPLCVCGQAVCRRRGPSGRKWAGRGADRSCQPGQAGAGTGFAEGMWGSYVLPGLPPLWHPARVCGDDTGEVGCTLSAPFWEQRAGRRCAEWCGCGRGRGRGHGHYAQLLPFQEL